MKKRSNRNRIFLAGLVILTVLIIFLLRADFLTIRKIELKSERIDCASDNQLKDSSQLLGQNLILLNSTKVESELKRKYLCIKNVLVSRLFPNKVKLEVFGREPLVFLIALKTQEASASSQLEKFYDSIATQSAEAIAEGPSDTYVIDNEGVIFTRSNEQFNIPKLYVWGQDLALGKKIEEGLIHNALKILERIEVFGVNVKEAKIYSERILLINATPKIIFSLDNRVEMQLASLQLILKEAKIDEENIEFIDLRFDKPVIRIAPNKKHG